MRHVYTRAHIHAHACTHARTHAPTHTRARTHTSRSGLGRSYAFEKIGTDYSGLHGEFKPALARIRQQVGLPRRHPVARTHANAYAVRSCRAGSARRTWRRSASSSHRACATHPSPTRCAALLSYERALVSSGAPNGPRAADSSCDANTGGGRRPQRCRVVVRDGPSGRATRRTGRRSGRSVAARGGVAGPIAPALRSCGSAARGPAPMPLRWRGVAWGR